jgi:hypothetical protein
MKKIVQPALSHLRRSFSRTDAIGLAAILLAILVWAMLPAIPQNPSYHQFADQRQWFGVPHPADTLSNIAFALVGVVGQVRLASHRRLPIRLGGALSRSVSHGDSSLSTNRLGQAHGANYCGPQAFASKQHFSRIAQFAERTVVEMATCCLTRKRVECRRCADRTDPDASHTRSSQRCLDRLAPCTRHAEGTGRAVSGKRRPGSRRC